MANDEICITRKIEVHLHLHSDDEEGRARRKKDFETWNTINDNLFKVANFIATHQFFNDAYEFRAKIHSPQYTKIENDLKNSQKLKLTQEQVRELKKEKSKLDKEIKEQMKEFLGGKSTQNSTYDVIKNLFLDIIPSKVLTCLNSQIVATYKSYQSEIEIGKRTLPNFKKGLPVPFPMNPDKILQLRRRNDGSIYVLFPRGLEWDLFFGKDPSNNREIVNRILSGEYGVGDSSIQQNKKGKTFLSLVVKIPKKDICLDSKRVVGVDLGINVPLCAALNDNENEKMYIGSREQFLKVREQLSVRKRELQRSLTTSTKGGRGRKQKLQALERHEGKERNWTHLQNHIFSKSVIAFAQKQNAGVIQMENLSGFGRDKNDEVDEGYKYILRYWSYFELQQMIEYKAKASNIEVRYVDPKYTSQTCSYCGHYEKGQRISQSTFVCKNPECEKGKGKKTKDGKYEGINADWNAARNIALSGKVEERKKKKKRKIQSNQ